MKSEVKTRLSWFDRECLVRVTSGAAPLFVLKRMRAHIENRPHLRVAYDALVSAELAASGLDFVAAQADGIEARMFATLDDVDAKDVSEKRAQWWAVPLAGTAIAAALFVVPMLAPSSVGEANVDELVARSLRNGSIGIKVRCLARDVMEASVAKGFAKEDGGIRVVGEVAAGIGASSRALACPNDGLLVFSFTNTTDAPVFVFVVGLNHDDDIRWYAPFTSRSESIAVAPGSADAMLTTVADLAPMQKFEKITLRAIFTSSPVTGATVASVIAQSKERMLSPSRFDRLPLTGTAEAQIELVLTSTKEHLR